EALQPRPAVRVNASPLEKMLCFRSAYRYENIAVSVTPWKCPGTPIILPLSKSATSQIDEAIREPALEHGRNRAADWLGRLDSRQDAANRRRAAVHQSRRTCAVSGRRSRGMDCCAAAEVAHIKFRYGR